MFCSNQGTEQHSKGGILGGRVTRIQPQQKVLSSSINLNIWDFSDTQDIFLNLKTLARFLIDKTLVLVSINHDGAP